MQPVHSARLRRVIVIALILSLAGIALVLARAHLSPPPPRRTLPLLRAAATSLSDQEAVYYTHNQSMLTRPPDVFAGEMEGSWSFDSGIPAGWGISPDAQTEEAALQGVFVATGTRNFEQQLRSPQVLLQPGEYQIVLRGRVFKGGLALGGEHGTDCLGNSFFSADQWNDLGTQSFMVHRLRLHKAQRVRITLSNWASANAMSRWKLESASIRARSIDQKMSTAYAASASPLVKMSQFPVTNEKLSWNIGSSVKDWTARGEAMVKTAAGRVVRTNRTMYGYEFTTQVDLTPGPYLLLLDGDILSGGMALGAVDMRRHQRLAQAFFWHGQNTSAGALATTLSVRHSGAVELVLANWSVVAPRSSAWRLRRIRLIQLF